MSSRLRPWYMSTSTPWRLRVQGLPRDWTLLDSCNVSRKELDIAGCGKAFRGASWFPGVIITST